MPSEIGSRLRALRDEFGLTQAFVAQRVGMRRSALSEVESGTRKVTPDELVELARLYGTTTDFLTSGQQDVPEHVQLLTRLVGDMTEDDVAQVVSFATFLRSRSNS